MDKCKTIDDAMKVWSRYVAPNFAKFSKEEQDLLMAGKERMKGTLK